MRGRIFTTRDWPKRAPPPSRARVLEYVRAEVRAGRPFPTPLEIAKQMGWRNAQSARDALMGLVRDGHVRMSKADNPNARCVWEVR